MPRDYEVMKAEFMKKGMSKKAAEGKAARIHNARAKPGQPIVTSAGEGYKKKKKNAKPPRNFHHDRDWL